MKKKVLGIIFAIIMLAVFTGCSGGGSSDSSSGGGTASVDFPTNAVEANATNENGQEVASIIEGSDAVDPSLFLMVSDEGSIATKSVILNLIGNIDFNKLIYTSSNALNETVSESYTDDCFGGGTSTYSVSGNVDTNSGIFDINFNVSYNNCAGVNGSMSAQMAGKINISTDNMESISKFRISIGSSGLTSSGISIAANSYFNITNVVLDNLGELTSMRMAATYHVITSTKKYGVKELVVDFVSGTPSTTDYISGQVYLNNLISYVTVDNCITPMTISGSTYLEGDCRFTAANNGKIKVYVNAGNLMVAVDPEGDGSFEAGELVN